jgi:peroxiredoxin
MPEFSLADSNAVMVNSNQLIQSGPLVVTFFRGMW